MAKPKRKLTKKNKKKPKRRPNKSGVHQNVNVKNVIVGGQGGSGGGGSGGGGSSSYPHYIPQQNQNPIPQSFRNTNTESTEIKELLQSLKEGIKEKQPQIHYRYNSEQQDPYRDTHHEFDPIPDTDFDNISEITEPTTTITQPFGSEASSNSKDLSQHKHIMDEINSKNSIDVEPSVGSYQNYYTPNQPVEDPNRSLSEVVFDNQSFNASTLRRWMHPEDQSINGNTADSYVPIRHEPETEAKRLRRERAKKEWVEYQTDDGKQMMRSNFTGEQKDISDWPQWDKNTFVKIDPNNPSYHINTKSGVYGNGRKNVDKSKGAKPKVNKSTSASKRQDVIKGREQYELVYSKV
jgi:hypothetical protein